MRLDTNRAVDRQLDAVYRWGAVATGTPLIIVGLLGVAGHGVVPPADHEVFTGTSATEALGFLMVAFGSFLVGGAILGGTVASTINITLGAVLVLGGLGALVVLDTPYNLFALRISNVIGGFLVGIVLLTSGMYGRFSGRLPYDNPYWRSRHPHYVPEPPRRARRSSSAEGEQGVPPPERQFPPVSQRRAVNSLWVFPALLDGPRAYGE